MTVGLDNDCSVRFVRLDVNGLRRRDCALKPLSRRVGRLKGWPAILTPFDRRPVLRPQEVHHG